MTRTLQTRRPDACVGKPLTPRAEPVSRLEHHKGQMLAGIIRQEALFISGRVMGVLLAVTPATMGAVLSTETVGHPLQEGAGKKGD